MKSLRTLLSSLLFAQLHQMFWTGKPVTAWISQLFYAHFYVVLDTTHMWWLVLLQNLSLWKMRVSCNAHSTWISKIKKKIHNLMKMRTWCMERRTKSSKLSLASMFNSCKIQNLNLTKKEMTPTMKKRNRDKSERLSSMTMSQITLKMILWALQENTLGSLC